MLSLRQRDSQSVELATSQVTIEEKIFTEEIESKQPFQLLEELENSSSPSNETTYSFIRDSVLGKYAANTAALTSVFDTLLHTLCANNEDFNDFINNLPFYVKGLYYCLPSMIPLFPYCRNRWRNKGEIYDPDAIELLTILKDHDKEFNNLINEDTEEKAHILEILTSYLKYEKNQPFNIIANIIFLTLRGAPGLILFSEGLKLATKETQEKLNGFAALLSTTFTIAYLCAIMLHTNFQKYHFPDKKKEILKESTSLQQTFFKMKGRLMSNAARRNSIDLVETFSVDTENNAKISSIS